MESYISLHFSKNTNPKRRAVAQKRTSRISIVKPTRCTIFQIYFILEQQQAATERV
jgi:hypothetical protein